MACLDCFFASGTGAQLGREIRGRNFLLRRQVTRSTELTTIHLPVELVHLHPLPASLWRQVVWLPCVLHRINHLLLADQVATHRNDNKIQ